MTPVEIAYFKHFLFDCGIQAIYISMYRKSRIKGDPEGDKKENPESLEQFLQEQPSSRVLMNAFYFQTNTDFGYDYWKEIDDKWKKYLELHADNPKNTKVVVLKGSFSILRQNWDRPQYWKTENMEATYARMHMEPPLKGVDLEKAFNVPRSITHGDKWVEPDHKFEEFWEKIDEVAQEGEESTVGSPDTQEEPQDASSDLPLDGFSLVEATNKHGGKKMSANTVSVNLKSGYRVTFSSKESDNLRSHKYEYVQLLTKDKTGEIALKFNHNNGCNVNIKGSKATETKNVVINSKDIVDSIRKFYRINKAMEYFVLTISSTVHMNNDTIYILRYEE